MPSIAMAMLVCTALAGCYRPSVLPQSEGHISTPAAQATAGEAPPPVRTTDFVPPPKPAVKPVTYSVTVVDMPVKELLFALARDTKQNIDIHPDLQGLVSINAVNETLPAILDRIAKQVDLRYRVEGNTIIVTPDTPYMKTYKVNYVNISRETTSTIGVSGQIQDTGSSGSGSSSGSSGSSGGQNSSSTVVTTKSTNNFWDALRENIRAILASTHNQSLSAEQKAARAEAVRAEREERLQQAEAAARAGQGAQQLFTTAFGNQPSLPSALGDVRDNIIINPVASTVSVLASEKQHALIQQYLDNVVQSSQRQVLIEATIAEVDLSDAYQSGIDWSRLASTANPGNGLNITQSLIGGISGGFTGGSLTVGYFNPTSKFGNISESIQLLNQFGNTRVLSSPKLMALNNQTALLKVVDNIVYFQVQAQQNTTQGVSTQTVNTTPQTVSVGVVMGVTPQINENGQVTLTVRPTISRVIDFKNDPNPTLTIPNPVPEIQIREMESVLQLVSGQTAVLGGLMNENIQYTRNAVPGIGNIPVIREFFSARNDNVTKSELVIFLRPTVVANPSLDSDALKFYQRFLPQQQGTVTETTPGETADTKP
ncbi:MAG TPA: pilus (MSHA type) biogenesis protein MshL [Burkholderiales bacterium]|nr:pilus (MSHA type) biogenesis protein MshL [Burkholderiales bacterium]